MQSALDSSRFSPCACNRSGMHSSAAEPRRRTFSCFLLVAALALSCVSSVYLLYAQSASSSVWLDTIVRRRSVRHRTTPLTEHPVPLQHTATLVVSHYDEDLSWLWALLDAGLCAESKTTKWQVWLSEKTSAGVAAAHTALSPSGSAFAHAACVTVCEESGGNWGREATSYLRFIADSYEVLPNAVIFVHGNALPHAPNLARQLPCLDTQWPASDTAARGFVSLSPHFMDGQLLHRGVPSFDAFAVLARRATAAATGTLTSETTSPLVNLSFSPTAHSCCATFIASRAALRAHPRAWWAALLDVAQSAGRVDTPFEGPPDQWAAAYMEQVWHHVLGEPLALPGPTPLCAPRGGGSGGSSPFLDAGTCDCGQSVLAAAPGLNR